jgi:cytochrome P450
MVMETQKQSSACPVSHGATSSTLADVGVLADPKDFYKALRQEKGLHYDPKLGAYLVSRYEDLQAVLSDPITFSLEKAWGGLWSEEFQAILARDGGGFFPDAIMTDPPNHTRVRRLIEKVFTAHRIKELEPAITAQAIELIEGLADRGKADGVKDLALPVTIRIMAAQLGMTDVDLETIERWSSAFTAQIGRMVTAEEVAENAQIVCECQHFVIDLVRQRQQQPAQDLISYLVHARTEDNDPVLTFGEIVASARAFLIGGNETISTSIGKMLLTLASRTDLARALYASLDDDRTFNRFAEELVRIAAPARATSRVTTRDVVLGGEEIPAGSLIMTMFGSANDDETQFSNSREFDMERANLGKHMGYGAGIHRCVGVSLARMEIKVITREIVRRLDDIRLAIPVEEISYRLNIASHAIESLPLIFRRRKQAA